MNLITPQPSNRTVITLVKMLDFVRFPGISAGIIGLLIMQRAALCRTLPRLPYCILCLAAQVQHSQSHAAFPLGRGWCPNREKRALCILSFAAFNVWVQPYEPDTPSKVVIATPWRLPERIPLSPHINRRRCFHRSHLCVFFRNRSGCNLFFQTTASFTL